KEVSKGLVYIKDHPQEEKRGRNRKTFYEYPRLDNNAAISPVKEIIQLEINTFTHPFPFEKHSIGTFIYKFLKDNQFNDSIEHYSLNPFSVNVLSLERTLFEKMLSLIRLSYEGSSSLRSKIRHFYDIASIMKMYNFSADSPDIFKSALEDDKTNATFAGKWLEVPLYKAPLFEKFKDIWADLSSTYKNELLKLIWSEKIISENEISKSFERIADFIQRNSK
ncbi:MAG TPA: nucleotidyl transferase AbiEii/AbiGii toxin family protein, partial [Spirochaetota bacterium]|nr:nucleotidyl transferase AbiEii/AbiGii toxin family protein [Spirochaetota bacterium]